MFDEPEHIVEFPEIVPGVAGVLFTVTDRLDVADEPQALFAFNVIVPPVEPAVADILLVVEVPVHPEGKVQV